MESHSRSIFDSLTRGFLAIGLLGSAILLLLGIFDLEDMLGGSGVRTGPSRVTPELIEHALFPLLFLLIPLFAGAIWVIRGSLAPLEAAAERIDSVPGMKRGYRVDTKGLPREAVPFVKAVNGLLQRLDDAAARQEAFAADAAHELKTPLSILLMELERLEDAKAQTLKAEVAEMSQLVDHLLLIAQLDAETAAPTPYEPVSLKEVAAAATRQSETVAQRQGKRLEFEAIEDVVVSGRAEAIKAAVRNLIDNGLRVTEPGGVVKVAAGPGALISVQDGGPGLSSAELERLGRRHERADHGAVEGFGLGLSIVSRIMEAHGGTLATVPQRQEIQLQFSISSKVSAS